MFQLGIPVAPIEYIQIIQMSLMSTVTWIQMVVAGRYVNVLLWKLYSDGHRFHKYQQNEQSPLLLSQWIHKDHDIWRCKYRSWLGTGITMLRVEPVNGITTVLSWYKRIYFQFGVHETSLEQPSSGTLNVQSLESQIN